MIVEPADDKSEKSNGGLSIKRIQSMPSQARRSSLLKRRHESSDAINIVAARRPSVQQQQAQFDAVSDCTSVVTGRKKGEFFVSNSLIEKIFDEIKSNQKLMEQRLNTKIKLMNDRIEYVQSIRENELPELQMAVGRCETFSRNLLHYFARKESKLFDVERKKKMFQLLQRHVQIVKGDEKKLIKVMNIFRKFHTYHQWYKYRRQVSWLVQLKQKDSIQGAFMLLQRYKNRLKGFDAALNTINASKVDQNEYDAFKTSLEKERSSTIFRDMQLLVDSQSASLQAQMKRDKNEFERIVHKIKEQTKDSIKAQEQAVKKAYGSKLNRLEKFMDNLVFDVAKLQSQGKIMTQESQVLLTQGSPILKTKPLQENSDNCSSSMDPNVLQGCLELMTRNSDFPTYVADTEDSLIPRKVRKSEENTLSAQMLSLRDMLKDSKLQPRELDKCVNIV